MPTVIDPWGSRQYEDYARLREEFGMDPFDPGALPEEPAAPAIFRRGVIFGQRDFGRIARRIRQGKPFAVMTGLMPSGKFHIGHKMVIDQVRYFQTLGAHVFIAVADYEAYATRGMSFERGRQIAIEEYLLNFIALGIRPEHCQFYFQSTKRAPRDLGLRMAPGTNLSEMKGIYGFEGSTNLGHVFSPLLQAGDVLHVQDEVVPGAKVPSLVPVGVDQDPHMRLVRGMADAHRLLSLQRARDGKVGIFAKTKDEAVVKSLLEEAARALERRGINGQLKLDYGALYLPDEAEAQADLIDDDLIAIESRFSQNIYYQVSCSFHRFMTAIDMGKMSSSRPESSVFFTDPPELVHRKVTTCKTTGGATIEEHRRTGGRPEGCPVFEMYAYHLTQDDGYLQEVARTCRSGERLCGDCKSEAAEGMLELVSRTADAREKARGQLDAYLYKP